MKWREMIQTSEDILAGEACLELAVGASGSTITYIHLHYKNQSVEIYELFTYRDSVYYYCV